MRLLSSRREKELAKQVQQGMKLGAKGVVAAGAGDQTIKVDDKYK